MGMMVANRQGASWGQQLQALAIICCCCCAASCAPAAAAVLGPKQRAAILDAIRPRAIAASAAASPRLLTELSTPEFRTELKRQLRGTGPANEALDTASSQSLLERLRAESQASEIVHNLALWSSKDRGSEKACAPSDCGWSTGNAQGAPRTPAFLRPQLDNLWLLGVETIPDSNESWVPPQTIVGWLHHPDSFEVADIGCDAFSGSVQLPPHKRGDPPRQVPFPKNIAEASQRPVYGIMDLKKLDAGAVDFGPVGLVFNRSQLDETAIFMPADTGQWSTSCNLTNQGRNASRCCISQIHPSPGCDLCVGNDACCQDDRSYNCTEWGTYGIAPGVIGHLDHILLSAIRTWNDTVLLNGSVIYQYTPAANLATLLARSVAAASNAQRGVGPLLQVHNNYYIEANLLANPQYGNGDVLFVIGQFPFLFGTERGEQLLAFAKKWALPVVWGLGPEGCYEQINQTGGECGNSHWSNSLGAGEAPYRASNRLLDPVACASTTSASTARAPAALAAYQMAWTDAKARRAAGA
jgi:hypothetical protein